MSILAWRAMVWVACLGLAGVAKAAPEFQAFHERATTGEPLTVVFFGASLTWGANASDPQLASYRARFAQRLQQAYPRTPFRFIDAAIGGTGSTVGTFRLDRDVLRHQPDLVLLDFTANDSIRAASPEAFASYEALLRRIIGEAEAPVIQMIFPFRQDAAQGHTKGMPRRDGHYQLAEAYGTVVGDAITLIQQRVAEGQTTLDEIWALDPIHPVDAGYALFAEAAWQAYQRGVREGVTCRLPPQMRYAPTFMTVTRARLSTLGGLPEGWRVGMPHRTSASFDMLMSRWHDDVTIARQDASPQPLQLTFTGTCVLVAGESTPRSGGYRIWIDGQPIHPQGASGTDYFDAGALGRRMGGHTHHFQVVASDLAERVEHTLVLEPVFGLGQDELRIESICVAGRGAAVRGAAP